MDKVLIAPITLAGIDGAFLRVLREAGFELVYPNTGAQLTEEELLRFLPGIKASLAGSEPYTRRVIEAAPGLKVIARVGVGYDAVDLAAATEHGVAVTIAPGTNQDAVAEHTFALILALAKGVTEQHPAVKIGQPSILVDGVEIPARPNIGVFTQPLSFIGLPIVSVPVFQVSELPSSVADRAWPAASRPPVKVEPSTARPVRLNEPARGTTGGLDTVGPAPPTNPSAIVTALPSATRTRRSSPVAESSSSKWDRPSRTSARGVFSEGMRRASVMSRTLPW